MHLWFRQLLPISLVSTYFVAYVAVAEPVIGFDTANPLPMQPTLGQLNTPVSPSDFKNRVKDLGQKNRDDLSQQFKQELSQQPKLPSAGPPTAPGTTIPVTGAPPATAVIPPPPETSIMQPQGATAGTVPSPTFSNSPPAASTPPPSSAYPPPPGPQQGNVYTGFGTGTDTGGGPPPSGGPSSGSGEWNVKY